MSMLAEPRQRKKYNLVPRGKALYEDENRFGTKMLEKMGWSKGKGLGAREDGLKDFVRIRYKNDAEGFGYENRDDQWTEHEKQFSGLLNSLNNSADNSDSEQIKEDIELRSIGFGFQEKKKDQVKNSISGESLEEKSKKSKARVHYKKFTQGKDLTRYSEKDLANIFGKKKLNDSQPENTLEAFNIMTQKLNEAENEDKKNSFVSGMNTFTNGTSVTDYFKQKMQRSKELKINETDAAIKSCENSESSVKNVFDENSISKKKKSKKRKHSQDDEAQVNDQNKIEEPTKKTKNTHLIENLESGVVSENPAEIIKTKKKKKKSQKDVEIISELTISSFDEELAKTKKKKKKSQKEEVLLNNIEKNSNKTKNIDEAFVQYEVQEAIKKKSKKSKNKQAEEILIENGEASLDIEMDKKKKKSRKEKTAISENETKTEITDKNFSEQQFSKELNSDDQIKKEKTKNIKSEMELDEEKASDILEKPAELNVSLKDSNDAFVISEFSAEKFRQTDLQAFFGSNISDVLGYGVNHSVNLVIKHTATDDKNIMDLWENATKIRNEILNQKYNTPMYRYKQKVMDARRLKKKMPKINFKQFQKKSAFNINV